MVGFRPCCVWARVPSGLPGGVISYIRVPGREQHGDKLTSHDQLLIAAGTESRPDGREFAGIFFV